MTDVRRILTDVAPRKTILYCSFCRRSSRVVEKLIAGPGVYICDVCVGDCTRIIRGRPAKPFPGWESLSEEQLLETLVPSAAAVDEVRDVLQQHVDLLRRRGVSWGRIGAALGISRQSAWERFS